MNKRIIAVMMVLTTTACMRAAPTPVFSTVQPIVPTATVTPTPPPNAQFSIGTQVYLKSDRFVVYLANEPRPVDGELGASQVCYTSYLPTVLSIVQKDGVIYYLLDCGGVARGWLPEDKIDSEPGR